MSNKVTALIGILAHGSHGVSQKSPHWTPLVGGEQISRTDSRGASRPQTGHTAGGAVRKRRRRGSGSRYAVAAPPWCDTAQ